ncbi:hypothetical protein [Parabacteroides faecis]|uniref:Uncharacterized protein n=1 Tax=Parabacteroides faecis TaxID=1217282 RepID=A0ABR6KMC0_9BACT|nr:hypothetical protein [Parabacteroides faecis]MBB4622666.1 hypothetical protein [Parabacteroides faecis]GGK08881.1 hypothetical protein GCM10007084_34940 [Parabacteroides faecis]
MNIEWASFLVATVSASAGIAIGYQIYSYFIANKKIDERLSQIESDYSKKVSELHDAYTEKLNEVEKSLFKSVNHNNNTTEKNVSVEIKKSLESELSHVYGQIYYRDALTQYRIEAYDMALLNFILAASEFSYSDPNTGEIDLCLRYIIETIEKARYNLRLPKTSCNEYINKLGRIKGEKADKVRDLLYKLGDREF